ncbi:MAG TPA: hypothetical protein VMJ10_06465 [Kofleriaceae bacterium]|nr:hypothetical protein [Kofleriaceae bacterium]
MKTLSLLVVLAAAPALAGAPKPHPPIKASDTGDPSATLKKLDFGDSLELGPRHHVAPPKLAEDAAPVQVKSRTLADAQVAKVVNDRLEDLSHCWNKLPAKQRMSCTAVLRMSVAPAGGVVDVTLGGDVPDGARECMISAVGHWTFPATETASQVEYPVALRAL